MSTASVFSVTSTVMQMMHDAMGMKVRIHTRFMSACVSVRRVNHDMFSACMSVGLESVVSVFSFSNWGMW